MTDYRDIETQCETCGLKALIHVPKDDTAQYRIVHDGDDHRLQKLASDLRWDEAKWA